MTDINFTQIESNGINMRLAHPGIKLTIKGRLC